MQWVFLVIALVAALVEMHSGTFYLAGVAAVALLAAVLGFWLPEAWLILVFVALCALVIGALMVLRRRRAANAGLIDFNIGQTVTVRAVSPHNNRLSVDYRGALWEAVTEDGSVLAPGDTAVITGMTDKLLRLVASSKAG